MYQVHAKLLCLVVGLVRKPAYYGHLTVQASPEIPFVDINHRLWSICVYSVITEWKSYAHLAW